VTSKAAATRYARALFDVALKEADVDRVGRELAEFAATVSGHEGLARVLSNPAIPAPRKRAIVEQVLASGGDLSPVLGKLLLMLADRDRLTLLGELSEAYQQRLMDHAQIVRAEVVTAAPLPADRLDVLKQGLARATGRQVHLDARVDPAIIGGAITRVGSTVYDGSVTTQLQKLKQTLIESEA
jgi:F-type H+-transporting ATPase subunit delta